MSPTVGPPAWTSSMPVCPSPPSDQRDRNRKFDADIVQSALNVLESDDYRLWIWCGLAVKELFGDVGFAMWEAWSKKSTKCRPNELRKRWNGFGPRRITAATIIHLAKVKGWRAPAKDAKTREITLIHWADMAGANRRPADWYRAVRTTSDTVFAVTNRLRARRAARH